MSLSHSPKIVTDGLVLCLDAANPRSYPKSGTTWSDLAGSNDGTMQNMTVANYSDEKRGVLSFDGSNEYIDCGTSPLYTNSLAEFSVSTWSYITVANFNGGLKVIYADAIDPSLGGFWVGYDDRGGTHSPLEGIAWNTKNTGGYSRGKTANNIISSDGWFNVVLTFSSSVGVTCYVNTQESTNRTINNTGDFSPRNNNFNIGRGPTDMSSAWYFNGSVASVAMYNKTLTADEVLKNYNAIKRRFK